LLLHSFFADGLVDAASRIGLTDFSILGGRHRRATETFLEENHLPIDFGGKAHEYDAVITGTDLIVPRNIRSKRLILVQEGMTEEEDLLYTLVRYLKFPRFIANNGLLPDYLMLMTFFVWLQEVYRDLFIRKGVHPEKIIVTGIPNYDNAAQYYNNDFPMRGYALVATSSIRRNPEI